MIPKEHRDQFNAIIAHAKSGTLALVEADENGPNSNPAYIIVSVYDNGGGEVTMVPLGRTQTTAEAMFMFKPPA